MPFDPTQNSGDFSPGTRPIGTPVGPAFAGGDFQASEAWDRGVNRPIPLAANFNYPCGFYMAGEGVGGLGTGIYQGAYFVQDLILQFLPQVESRTYDYNDPGPFPHPKANLTPAFAAALGATYAAPPTQPANALITVLAGSMTPHPVFLSALLGAPMGDFSGYNTVATIYPPALPDGTSDTLTKSFNNNAVTYPYYCFDNSGTDAETLWTDQIIPGVYYLAFGINYTLATCHFKIFAVQPGGVPVLVAETTDGVNYTLGPHSSLHSSYYPFNGGNLTAESRACFFDSSAAFGGSNWRLLVQQYGMRCDFSGFFWEEAMANVLIGGRGAGIKPQGTNWSPTVDYISGIDTGTDAFLADFGLNAGDYVSRSVYVLSPGGPDAPSQPGAWGSINGERIGP